MGEISSRELENAALVVRLKARIAELEDALLELQPITIFTWDGDDESKSDHWCGYCARGFNEATSKVKHVRHTEDCPYTKRKRVLGLKRHSGPNGR